MTQRDEIDFVIRGLARYRGRDAIIRDLCEQSGYRWQNAAALVRWVELEQADQIQARRRPLLLLMSILFYLAGLALIAYGVSLLMKGEPVPVTAVFYLIEIDLADGGQAIPFILGLPLFIGGIAGLRLALSS